MRPLPKESKKSAARAAPPGRKRAAPLCKTSHGKETSPDKNSDDKKMQKLKKAAVIDYGMGNLMSVLRAWQRAGADARLVGTPEEICEDDILVFPGQGAITDAMRLLNSSGFSDKIRRWIDEDKPFFGICLGLQALFEYSEEGDCPCLGIFRGTVERLRPPREYKVPHMGWNNVDFFADGEFRKLILKGVDARAQFYFVHSYCAETPDKELVFGTTEYGGKTFVSAVARGKLVACQFHPEKSQSEGLKLYANFLEAVS